MQIKSRSKNYQVEKAHVDQNVTVQESKNLNKLAELNHANRRSIK